MKTLFSISNFGFRISELVTRFYTIPPVIISILVFTTFNLKAQVYSEQDVEICNQKFQISVNEDLKDKPINEVVVEIGESFIGTDYLAKGLEVDGDEQLVINLTGLDCTTLVENTLVISRCVKMGTTSFDEYLAELQYIRYRDGMVEGYPSRLHYFSDWITDNVAMGIVADETKEFGGVPIQFNLNFMSTHPESYKQLNENPELIPIIEKQEEEISLREYYYIPKEDFSSKEKCVRGGDIIAVTTTVEGLDIGHIGIAVKMDDGRIHLLHAPNVNTEVQITEEPLADYLMKYKRHSGVIVLKVLEPSNLPD